MRHSIISCFAIFAIIGLLVALVGPWFIKSPKVYINQGPRADVMGGIKSAIGGYYVDVGHYPRSLHDLVQKPNTEIKWHGPYFDPPKVPLDYWGHEFIYEFPGKHNPGSYDVMSLGSDGKKGTEDDIGNW